MIMFTKRSDRGLLKEVSKVPYSKLEFSLAFCLLSVATHPFLIVFVALRASFTTMFISFINDDINFTGPNILEQ